MRPLPGVADRERGLTSHGNYSHTRNSEKAQVADLILRVGGVPAIDEDTLRGRFVRISEVGRAG